MYVGIITNPTVLFCLHIGTEAERIMYYTYYLLYYVLYVLCIFHPWYAHAHGVAPQGLPD